MAKYQLSIIYVFVHGHCLFPRARDWEQSAEATLAIYWRQAPDLRDKTWRPRLDSDLAFFSVVLPDGGCKTSWTKTHNLHTAHQADAKLQFWKWMRLSPRYAKKIVWLLCVMQKYYRVEGRRLDTVFLIISAFVPDLKAHVVIAKKLPRKEYWKQLCERNSKVGLRSKWWIICTKEKGKHPLGLEGLIWRCGQ